MAPVQHEINKLVPADLKGSYLSPTHVIILCITLVVLGTGATLFFWARLLLGVAIKYNIGDAMDSPDSFMYRTMMCICATNVRVGLHVDRAQGFEKPCKADLTMV